MINIRTLADLTAQFKRNDVDFTVIDNIIVLFIIIMYDYWALCTVSDSIL